MRRVPPPTSHEVKWCAKGSYILSLGVPIGNQHNPTDFLMTKYAKMKSLISKWKRTHTLTVFGRSMLANSMIYSRLRYWTECMIIPKHIHHAIESDVDSLIWNKRPKFQADELGTTKTNNRWIRRATESLPIHKGGIGRLAWYEHVSAIQAKWALKYMDASRASWKYVLDMWLSNRYASGRGCILCIPNRRLLFPHIAGRGVSLPPFFKQAIHSLRNMHPTPVHTYRFLDPEEAKAEPLFDGRIHIHPSHQDRMHTWTSPCHL